MQKIDYNCQLKNLLIKMTNLRDVCYKQIKDKFFYGLFGDFKIIVDYNTGYFNATKLCSAGGKRFTNWMRNKEAQELIEFYRPLSDLSGVPLTMEINKKGDALYNSVINGIYVSSKLICSIAVWISNEFYDKVNTIVNSYYIREYKEKYECDIKELENKLLFVETKMKKIELENENIKHENGIYKIDNKKYRDDITPKTSESCKLNMLFIVKKNKPGSKYPYYVIRCQKLIYKRRLGVLKLKYPLLEIVYKLNYNPNVINLFNRIKENIPYIRTKFNHLLVNDFSKFTDDLEKLIPKLKIQTG